MSLRLRNTWILFVALGIQGFFVISPPEWLDVGRATQVYVATLVAVAAFLALNRKTTGLAIVAVGLVLNGAAILANGAMPVSQSAASFAGAELLTDARHVDHGTHLRNERLTDETKLSWLSDVIPLPGLKIVTSAGDLIIAAGLVRLIWSRTDKKSLDRAPVSANGSRGPLDPVRSAGQA
jgi:hypothetical protein